jgi:predicted small lipoprotein YifL
MTKKTIKVLSLVLACTMLIGVLAGCGTPTPVATTEVPTEATQATQATQATEATQATTPSAMPLVVAFQEF